jgi:hypothetical protein
MDANDLEQIILDQENRLREQAQTIAEFSTLADRAILLESKVLDQQQIIAQLNAQLANVKTPDTWDKLTEGWMNSAIGKRALLTPGVDLTGFQMGVDRQNFKLIQLAYAQILEMLKLAGVAATISEQQEIGILLKTLGFA